MKLFPEQQEDRPAATSEALERTGFGENWNAALGLAISEDLPIVSRMVTTTVESQRKNRIMSAVESGEIPQGIRQFYGDDFNGLAGYARDVIGLEGFVTDEEYEEQRNGEYKMMREYSQGVFAKATTAGSVGQMAGYAHAMAVDPLYASSFLTGYGTAATIGQAALRVGLMEAGIEAVAQIPKMLWKEDIESECSGAQAFTEIAFAGLGSAVVASIGKSIGRAMAPKDLTVGQATEVLERMAKDNPEMEPVLNTIRHADPEDNLADVLKADEAIDIDKANEGPRGRDPLPDAAIKKADIDSAREEAWLQRQPDLDEGVPRGTPKDEPDTRGQGVQYHGTSQPIEFMREGTFTEQNIYGQGFYTTDALDIATGYTKKGKGREPTIYQVEEPDVAVKNLDDAVDTDFAKWAGRSLKSEAVDTILDENPASFTELFDEVRGISESLQMSANEVQEVFESIQRYFMGKGFGAYEHVGGKLTGKDAHKVRIFFPGSDAKLTKLETQRAGAPKPDTRHPMVKAADDLVVKEDAKLTIMEECF